PAEALRDAPDERPRADRVRLVPAQASRSLARKDLPRPPPAILRAHPNRADATHIQNGSHGPGRSARRRGEQAPSRVTLSSFVRMLERVEATLRALADGCGSITDCCAKMLIRLVAPIGAQQDPAKHRMCLAGARRVRKSVEVVA